MTKTAFTYCMALLCTAFCYAQPNFEVSEPYEVVDAAFKNYYSIGNQVYSLKVHNDGAVIQQFDPNTMQETKRAELEMPKDYLIEEIVELNQNQVVFYSQHDDETNTDELYSRVVDLKRMSWQSEAKLMFTTQQEVRSRHKPYGSSDPRRRFSFFYSSDSSTFLVKYQVFSSNNDPLKNPGSLGIFVFDSKLDKLWGEEKAMPYADNMYTIFDITVNREGNAFLIAKVYEKETNGYIKESERDHRLEIFAITSRGRDLFTSQPEFSLPVITNIHFSPYRYKQNVAITGLYKTSKDGHTDSFFFWEVSPEGKVINEEKFSMSLRDLKMNEKKYAQSEKRNSISHQAEDLDNLQLQKVELCDDGQLLIFEKHQMITTEYGSFQSQSDQLVAVKLNNSQKIEWMRYLPKKQTSRWFIDPVSYLYTKAGNRHFFLYIDHYDNEEFKHTKDQKTYSELGFGNLSAYVLNESTGELTKEIILNTEKIDRMELHKVKASKIIPLGNEEFMFEAYKKKKEDIMIKFSLRS